MTTFGTHFDLYTFDADGNRYHSGMVFEREQLLGEHPLAFQRRVERSATELAKSGLTVTTRFMSAGQEGRQRGYIELRLEPTPAPLSMQRPRGCRAGQKRAA